MSFSADDFVGIVETLAPSSLACSWDNVGFQIGSRRKPVQRILCALEVTPDVLKDARVHKADLLLVHHPLLFHPASSITDDTSVGRLVMEIIRLNLCLIVAHTNLDKSPHGTNRALAECLELSGVEFLEPESAIGGGAQYGMGCVGQLPREMTLKKLVTLLRKRLDAGGIQLIGEERKRVRRVAVVTGSGGKALGKKKLQDADVLVTGEINHHAALSASLDKIAVICAGHFDTEIIGMDYFARVLKKHPGLQKAGVEILVAKHQKSPYTYC